ncbi:hypothetical protein [Acinetobacter lactucae]|uniref:hypothetical protein n=1 Tax=Acinetobacter lactucae TaxID=1785128 RepID=UPI00157FC81D|nr:hypothetical protein [Acinetobacter lactucae]NUF39119.1 hypothetical protein [Acinetobacter lactucae]
MSNANNKAVQHLIEIANSLREGTATYSSTLEALGEAGGEHAVEYLINVVNSLRAGTGAHQTAIKALGRAGRITE